MNEFAVTAGRIVALLTILLTFAAMLIWVERRLLGLWQDRYGPNRVGPLGLLQVMADMIKIFMKEDWIPAFADKTLFVLAPAIIMITILMSFVVIPITPSFVVADLNVGLLFILAMSSLTAYSAVLAGWASNSKYALLGGLRASAQMLSYEVFMGLSVMGVVMLAGSFNLRRDRRSAAGLWFCIPQFLGFVIFVIAGLAETKRVPFDIPEAEAELVAGLPHGVFRHEVRHVLRGGVSRHPPHFGADRRALFRRLARSMAAAGSVVLHQDFSVHRVVHPHTGNPAEGSVRPIDGIRMENHAAVGAAEPGHYRRAGPGQPNGYVADLEERC